MIYECVGCGKRFEFLDGGSFNPKCYECGGVIVVTITEPSVITGTIHGPDADKSVCTNKATDVQVGGDHYKKMKIQPIVFCQANQLNAAESLAIKYICRHGSKNGRKDIEKAIHCLQLLLELEYPEVQK